MRSSNSASEDDESEDDDTDISESFSVGGRALFSQRTKKHEADADIFEKWGPFKKIVKAVTKVVTTPIKNTVEEAVSSVETVYEDVEAVSESVIEDAHGAIVKAYGNVANFIEKNVAKAIDMLAAAFACMRDVFAPVTDCAGTWLKQSKHCMAGKGCQFAIGYPKCSSLSTSQTASITFAQYTNGTMHTDDGEGALENGQGVEESEFENETLLGPDDENETDSIEPVSGGEPPKALLQMQEDGAHITGSWESDHGDSDDSHGVQATTSGSFSLYSGCHVHVNLDSGRVTAQLQADLSYSARIEASATLRRRRRNYVRKTISKKYLPYASSKYQLLRKVVMIGKTPCEVVVSVRLREHGYLTVYGGDFVGGVKVSQTINLKSTLGFTFNKLTERPSYEWHATYWHPTVEPYVHAAGTLAARWYIGPVFELTVNRAPLRWGFGPMIAVFAEAQYSSSGCSNANFGVQTNLAGSMEVGLPQVDPAGEAYNACMAMKQAFRLNMGTAAANCLSKAVLNFDMESTIDSACKAMKKNLPTFPAKQWDWSLGSRQLTYKDYGSDVCHKNKCKNIQMVSRAYGQENSWTIGNCRGSRYQSWSHSDVQNCCLAPGTYDLACDDSYGDGWHGGSLKINGLTYCASFRRGRSAVEKVKWD